jgi:hypothetical protein
VVSCATLADAAEPEPIALRYRVHAACPAAAAFVREVAARTQRARIALDAEFARTFDVTISESSGRSIGRIDIRDPDGARSVREVDGPDCAEVVSALALIGALAVDPAALAQPTPAPVAPAVPPEPPAAGPVAPPTHASKWALGMGADAVATGAVAPWIVPAASGFLELSGESPFAVVMRLSVAYAPAWTRQADSVRSTDSQFWWWALRAEGCPLRVGIGSGSHVNACATFDAGRLGAKGTPNGGSVQVGGADACAWYAPGALVRVDQTLGRGLFLEAEADAFFPLVRQKFVFSVDGRPAEEHRVPAVGGAARAGIGYHFQ